VAGYTRKRKTYRLEFDGTDQDGLTVRIRGLTIAQLDTLQEAEIDNTVDGRRATQELLAEQLVEWNMEDDDGRPLPPTLDSIRSLDPAEFSAIISAWATAIAGVTDPLEPSSNGGAPSLEASIPMAPPSDALAS
jgi:hypothetical protein